MVHAYGACPRCMPTVPLRCLRSLQCLLTQRAEVARTRAVSAAPRARTLPCSPRPPAPPGFEIRLRLTHALSKHGRVHSPCTHSKYYY